MCGACAGGRRVSSATAILNNHHLKPGVRAEVQARLGRRARVSRRSDTWVARGRTGRMTAHASIDELMSALVQKQLLSTAERPAENSEDGELTPTVFLDPLIARSIG